MGKYRSLALAVDKRQATKPVRDVRSLVNKKHLQGGLLNDISIIYISHTIHGTAILTYMKTMGNQPFMYVNMLYMDVALSQDASDHPDYMFGLPVTPPATGLA